ncbi:Ca2+-transporting ATPase [Thermodesulfitimonas autotrophica]|uniref:P-type Ca(2+) transporter n=1 Tax=Thermodesulfitimonas autotrophica TaxID=1894989 RepID=A0A3N5BFJ8_9THEO|nr:cation-translocating P-type ATPase [Thermodesulfitimonas autotrophica]RPF46862.1 Ca2+-transporting ATPase [Thermodesulfitimonas autotrophica]
MTNAHEMAPEAVLHEFGSDAATGLSSPEAGLRRQKYGPNELTETPPKSPWRILWEQLTAAMVVVLIVAAVVSLFLGEYKDAVAILVIVVLNAILGFTQEYRAERAMAALKKFAVPAARVLRDGKVQEIPARELVPGDIFFLEAGNIVPADGRLLQAANLKVFEAILTGESVPVEKNAAAVVAANAPLGDRENMVYKGTTVTYGRGLAVAVATGMKTELGRVAALIQTVEREPTPLQRRMAALGRALGVIALVIVAVVTGLGIMQGQDLKTMFLTGVSLAVAAVPEGLPAAVTIALALGAQRMLRRRALIRKLPAVETLGSVTKICTDKTGTLTQNRMTVTTLLLPTRETTEGLKTIDLSGAKAATPLLPPASLLLTAGALCNDAVLTEADGQPAYVGDPTEGALVVAAARFDLRKPVLENFLPRVAEIPFTSERKRMTTIHQVHEECRTILPQLCEKERPQYIFFTKGAVDGLLQICDRVWVDGRAEPLSEWQDLLCRANERLSRAGLRVLAVAFRPFDALPEAVAEGEIERDLIFAGFVGMIDPPRPEAKEAVATCRRAGIDPVMITGDHPLTALAIARELGIAAERRVLTGQELEALAAEELENLVDEVSVYARVAPEDKLKIVAALQKKGHIVAMTGDGVNDAPALKKADIGVAMGITGTDVSKEAADMVLLDDNFATIVAAVEEGRVIYDNVRKFLKYLMTTNLGEILVIFAGMLSGMPVPLAPLQILWVNLVTDGFPALALSVEPAEPDVMRRPPPKPQENIFAGGLGTHILWVGGLMTAICLGIGYWLWRSGNPAWQTVLFTTLAFAQLAHVLAIRTGKTSLFTAGLLSNRAACGAVLLTVALQLAVVYTPALQGVFRTVALTPAELLLCFALGSLIFWAVEIEKWLTRRRRSAPARRAG